MKRLAMLNDGKTYDSELIVSRCQLKIRGSGICKQELRKIDKDLLKKDLSADTDTRFKRFKNYYITKTAGLAVDEVQGTTNQANSVKE